MTRRGNLCPVVRGRGAVCVEGDVEMSSYDALPGNLRALLRDAPIRLSAAQLLQIAREHGPGLAERLARRSIHDIVHELQQQDADDLADMRRRLGATRRRAA